MIEPKDVKEVDADLEEETTAAETEPVTIRENDEGEQDQEVDQEVAENEAESVPVENTPEFLSESDTKSILGQSNLPKFVQEKLADGEYATEAELQEAIEAEIAYIKKITGAGQPSDLGETFKQQVSVEEVNKTHDERVTGILRNVGIQL